MRPPLSSTPRFPKDTQPARLVHPESPVATPRLLLYQGPEVVAGSRNDVRDLVDATGLPRLTLSHDEARGQARNALKLALRHLGASPHIVLDVHGNQGNRHGVSAGGLLGEPKGMGVPTADLLAWMAFRLGRRSTSLPVFHVTSCKAGHLADEIVPGSDRWRAAYVILYAGKQEIALGQIASAFNAGLQYLKLCQQRGTEPDPLRLFLLAGMRRGDCMTLLGGDLAGPVRWHGPKSVKDLADSGRLAALMDGHPDDLERLARVAGAIRPDEEALLPDLQQAESDIFQARLVRMDIARMREMLLQRPALANTPECQGSTPLLTAIDNCCVQSVDLLVEHGALLDARDGDGDTPLLYLAKTKPDSREQASALPIAARLLALGADPNQHGNDGDSVLACAVKADWIGLVTLLLAHGADPHGGEREHRPLAIARRHRRPDIARILKQAGARE